MSDVIEGRYQLRTRMGRGGMAEVWGADDLRLGRPVALKFLLPALAESPDLRRRFNHEARAAARVVHPNVVATLDTGEHRGAPFIVMECLSGRTLADELTAGPLAEQVVRRWILQVLDGLEAAHRAGVVHRDIKPSNVLLTASGDVKVADFGIARLNESVERTSTGLVLGTASYLAPERLAGAPATPASDVYAVGVVLYEALSGLRPFSADTPLATLRAVAEVEPPPLEGVGPDLAAAASRAMAKDPARRFPTAEAMAVAIGDATPGGANSETTVLLETAGVGHDGNRTVALGVGGGAYTRPMPPTRRPVALAGAAAAVLVAVVVAVSSRGTGSTRAPAHRNPEPVPPAVSVERALDNLQEAVDR